MSPPPANAARPIDLKRFLPFLAWGPRLDGAGLRADALAGLTGALVVLPQGVAFATIAGMPPEYGLYASIVPTIIAALFGSSWHLVAGPSTTASLVLFASLSALEPPGTPRYVELALTLAAMAGLVELALGVFKLGAVVNFISHTVVVGYTAGVGVLIMTTQARGVLGLASPRSSGFVETIRNTVLALPSISIAVSAVALVTLVVGVVARARFKAIPYMLPAIVAGCLAGVALNAMAPGSVTTVGALPAHLPPLSAPSFDLATWSLLIPTALAISISALNEVVSIGRALAIRSEQHLNINQEFIGQGLANLVGSFFSGYVVSGSFNRSALNYESGARSQASAIFAGAILAVVLIVAAPLAAYLPHAAMAASLELVGWSLIDRRSLAAIWRAGASERGVLIATVGVALFIQVQMAILAGVALSLLIYLYRTSNPQLRPRVPDPQAGSRKFADPGPDRPECPQLRLLRLDGSLYFGAVNRFRESLREFETQAPECARYAIIMQAVNFIDHAGAETLALEARRLKARGGALYFIATKDKVVDYLSGHGYLEAIGPHNFFKSKTTALREIYRALDYDRCRACRLRVFVECARLGKQEPREDGDETAAAPAPAQ